jgi:hypothetical protein
MENLELNTAVYNTETEKVINNEIVLDTIRRKSDDDIISEFDKQNKVDDSILNETPAEVENDNMSILLNAA